MTDKEDAAPLGHRHLDLALRVRAQLAAQPLALFQVVTNEHARLAVRNRIAVGGLDGDQDPRVLLCRFGLGGSLFRDRVLFRRQRLGFGLALAPPLVIGLPEIDRNRGDPKPRQDDEHNNPHRSDAKPRLIPDESWARPQRAPRCRR